MPCTHASKCFCRTSHRSRSYACLSDNRYGAGEWTPPPLILLDHARGLALWRRCPWFSEICLPVTNRDKLSTDPFDQLPAILSVSYLFRHFRNGSSGGTHFERDLEMALLLNPLPFPFPRGSSSPGLLTMVLGTLWAEIPNSVSGVVSVKWNHSSFPMHSRAIP